MSHPSKKRRLNGGGPSIENPVPSPTPAEPEVLSPIEAPIGDASAPKSFRDLGVIKELCDACDRMGFASPRPIQEEAIPFALQGRDIIGIAETGSGKTAAFALPMLQGRRPIAFPT